MAYCCALRAKYLECHSINQSFDSSMTLSMFQNNLKFDLKLGLRVKALGVPQGISCPQSFAVLYRSVLPK